MQGTAKQNQWRRPVRVGICIATLGRPRSLQTLLEAIAQMRFAKVHQPDLTLFIVDNDPETSAKQVCEFAAAAGPWQVRYICEPRRGIARARNRTLEYAEHHSDFLAFIDDDEAPSPFWMDELLWAQAEFGADVVSGMVLPAFAEDVPVWIRDADFFRRPVFQTGDAVKLCSTNNALIRTEILKSVPSFDEIFNFTGGEDTHFFLRVREQGFRMVFSKEAVVYEFISAERANSSWLLRRGFQAGNSWALCERQLRPGLRNAVLRILKEIAHITRGTWHLLLSPFSGKAHALRSLQMLSSGIGTLAGVAGHRFLPYGRGDDAATSNPSNCKAEQHTSCQETRT